MADLNQIRENSLTYNGPRSKITHTAEEMILVGIKALDEVGAWGWWVGLLTVTTDLLFSGSRIDCPSGGQVGR